MVVDAPIVDIAWVWCRAVSQGRGFGSMSILPQQSAVAASPEIVGRDSLI